MKPQTFLFSASMLFSSLMIIILICTNTAVCQEVESIDLPTFQSQDNFILSSASDCVQRANKDIEKGDARLIICFSFEGKKERGSEAFYSNQTEFEEKYAITYKLYNCTAENEKCVENYNEQVFKHLRRKFGRKWKKEVRADVYGLK